MSISIIPHTPGKIKIKYKNNRSTAKSKAQNCAHNENQIKSKKQGIYTITIYFGSIIFIFRFVLYLSLCDFAGNLI